MFIQELKDVLYFVKDLKKDDQKRCAQYLRLVVRQAEDHATMTDDQLERWHELNREAGKRKRRELLDRLKQMLRDPKARH